MGLPRFAHHLGALVDANCISFSVLREQALLRFLIRARSLPPSHPTYISVTSDLNNFNEPRARSLAPRCLLSTSWEALLTQSVWLQRLSLFRPHIVPMPAVVSRLLIHLRDQPSSTHLSRLDVDELALPMTHLEWRTDSAHPTTAPLQLVKTAPGKSTYLYQTSNPLLSQIARLRHNRVFTQVSRKRFNDPQTNPECTWPVCRANPPVQHDSVLHILAQCGRHNLSRSSLSRALHVIDPARFQSANRVSLPVVFGQIYPHLSLSIVPKCQRVFAALGDFFYHLTLERGGNGGPNLGLFTS
jgi:hypothetical protein